MSDNNNRVRIGLSGKDEALSPVELKEKQKQFQELYETHYQMSYRYLRGSFFDPEDISDILGNAFESAWKSFDNYAGLAEGTPEKKYWFLGILKNSAKQAWRHESKKRDRQISIETTTSDSALKSNTATPEDLAIRQDQEASFDQVIGSLPDKYAVVVRLRLEGFDYKEISKLLEISVAAAEIRMRRALLKLKEPLERYRNIFS